MGTFESRYKQDAIYFLILFLDPDLHVPIVRTLRFVGATRRKDGSAALMFRDVDPQGKKAKIIFGESEAAEVVLGPAGLMARLTLCFAGTLATSRPD